MGLDKKLMRTVTLKPAIEEIGPEGSIEPPLGTLTISDIAEASEEKIDEMLRDRYGLYAGYLFKEEPPKPLVYKRIALARLEGIRLGTIVDNAELLGSGFKSLNALKVHMSNTLEPTVVEKIQENSLRRIRFSGLTTDPHVKDVLQQIVSETGLEIDELFDTLPPYKNESRGTAVYTLGLLLEAYYLAIQGGLNWLDIVQRLKTHPDYAELTDDADKINEINLSQTMRRHFSDDALKKLRIKLGKPTRSTEQDSPR